MTSADGTAQHHATKPHTHILILSMPPAGNFRCPQNATLETPSPWLQGHAPSFWCSSSFLSGPTLSSFVSLSSPIWLLSTKTSQSFTTPGFTLCSGHVCHAQSFYYQLLPRLLSPPVMSPGTAGAHGICGVHAVCVESWPKSAQSEYFTLLATTTLTKFGLGQSESIFSLLEPTGKKHSLS